MPSPTRSPPGYVASAHTNRHRLENVVEEIEGLLKVYKDGHVERLPAMPDVPCAWTAGADVASFDSPLNNSAGLWARFYVLADRGRHSKLPLLVYFHGGGFCVGSAAWRCYHEFLARLAAAAGCLVMSVNYRLAPENRLPAAYHDGLAAAKWLRRQASCGSGADQVSSWRRSCDFSRVLLGGDSAGGSIAYHVAAQLGSAEWFRGVILIQPFFGGEKRTSSEKKKNSKSVLTMAASDCYWRLALPAGADRDHPWCNPLSTKSCSPSLEDLRLPPAFVCVSDMDVLKDRNLQFCKAMRRAGKRVEYAVYRGVGHAFQILSKSQVSKIRTEEMLADISAFICKT